MDRSILSINFFIIFWLLILHSAYCLRSYKKDAIAIHFALVGHQYVNEDTIINIVSQKTPCQLQRIFESYQSRYGQNIIYDIKNYLTGKFEEIIIALFTNSTYFYAQELYNAFNGIKNNENAVIDILLTQNYIKLQAIQNIYFNNYMKSLKNDLEQFTTNNLKKLYIKMLEIERNETNEINYINAEKLARELYHAAIPETGEANPDRFADILTSVSYAQLRHIIMKFFDIFDQRIETVIENSFPGDFSRVLIGIVQYAKSKEGYIANRLYDNLVNDLDYRNLIRLTVIARHFGLHSIQEAIQIRYRVTFEYFLAQIADVGFQKTLSTFLLQKTEQI